jgi:hypothetical protein
MFPGIAAWLLAWSVLQGTGAAAVQETLPPPRPAAPLVQGYVPERPPLSPFARTGWRPLPPEPIYGYARDRYGYMRPRIIVGPHGTAYYPLTGEHYPFYPIRTAP